MEQLKRHIALVDDEKEVLVTLCRQLEHLNYKCSTFSDGNSALEAILSDNSFDLLISDVRMPGLSGLELTRRVREVNCEIPIILITGFGDMQLTIDAFRSGATDYLSKPYEINDLKESIEKIIQQKYRGLKYDKISKFLTNSQLSYTVKAKDVDVVSISSRIADFLYELDYYSIIEKLNFGLALTEALINSNDHGNLALNSGLKESEFEGEDKYNDLRTKNLATPKYADRVLKIDVVTSASEAKIIIKDQGKGFNTSKFTEVDPLDIFLNEKNHGRGITLMQLYTDDIKYNSIGNEITIIKKKLSSTSEIEELKDEQEVSIFEQLPVGIIEINSKNEIISWNKAASEISELDVNDVLNKQIFTVFDKGESSKNTIRISKINAVTFKTSHFKLLFSENIKEPHENIFLILIDINDWIKKANESEELLNQMVVFNDLSRTISAAINIDEFLETLTQQLIWVFQTSIVSIYLYDSEEKNYFLGQTKSADNIEGEANDLLTASNSPIIKLLENTTPLIFNYKSEHHHFDDLVDFETIAYYPVVIKEETVAIISMASVNASHFTDAVKTSLELLTDIISISLSKVMLYEDVTNSNNDLNNTIHDFKDAKDAIEQQAGYLSQLLDETEEARRLIEKQNETKERELNKAAVLQDNLLPEKMFESDICAFESIYIPCNEVAGDIYDVIKFDDGRIGIIIADVSDHGVSSAMIAAMFKMVFLIYARQYDSPKIVFEKINEALNETINTGDFVTAFYGILDPQTKEFKYSSAGHPDAIVCNAFGENVRLLNTDGFFIGMFDFSDFQEKTVTLESGDHILMYTDGIYEVKNKAEEEYSTERLEKNFIDTIQEMNMFPLATLLVTAEEYSEGVPYDDDLTLLHTIIK